MRQIVLDTETTGLETQQGHRIIEIGCVELVNRRLTGNNYHQYINPEREIDEGALEVHGLDLNFLGDKPVFAEIAADFMQYIDGAELIIHNAPFDVGFLDHELKLLGDKNLPLISQNCKITDSLKMARHKHPGQSNKLDALCRRYEIDNSHRTLHGALLDSEILAEVYLAMTGGQVTLSLSGEDADSGSSAASDKVKKIVRSSDSQLPIIKASAEEMEQHQAFLEMLQDKSGDQCVWLKQ